MKRYAVFAGINGAGKSTFHNEFYEPLPGEKRINTDEMVARIGSWRDGSLQMKCARESVRLIKQYLDDGISFNQETTMAGKSIIGTIKTAKTRGYEIHLHYVGLESADIALQRIAKRVAEGGHGIPADDVVRRYGNSFGNLCAALKYCDHAALYDNSVRMRLVAKFNNGNLVYKSQSLPGWLVTNTALRALREYYF